MKTIKINKTENYVSPEVEIIDFTLQSGILGGSGEQVEDCPSDSVSWCTSNS